MLIWAPSSKPTPPTEYEVDWSMIASIGSLLFAVLIFGGLIAGIIWLFARSLEQEDLRRREAEARRLEVEARRRAAEAEAARQVQARWDDLARRYGPEIAGRIWRKEIWQGQTEEQLIESKGPPMDIDEKVSRAKIKRIFKYYWQGANRYGLRVMLEDGVVVGWEDKR